MKAVINVKGTKLSVLSIHYKQTGEPFSVYAMDENGRESLFIDKSQSQYDTRPHIAVENLGKLLEYPEIEARLTKERENLISHIEELYEQESSELTKLSTKPFSFKLTEKRVAGLFDAIEEVKAFHEGYGSGGSNQ